MVKIPVRITSHVQMGNSESVLHRRSDEGYTRLLLERVGLTISPSYSFLMMLLPSKSSSEFPPIIIVEVYSLPSASIMKSDGRPTNLCVPHII